jgi:hypothetical protein
VIEDLQRVADALAKRLDRAVAIDDANFRLLVYTSHIGEVDAVRAHVVLTREAPPDAAAFARSFGITKASGPVRIPGNPELDLLPRVCVPVQCKGVRFGWLWLIDPGESLGDAELELASAAAGEAGQHLYWDRVSKEFSDARGRELLRDLLSGHADVRGLAARELVEGGHFIPSADVVAVVWRPMGAGARALPEETRLALAGVLDQCIGLLPPRETLRLVRPDHALLVTLQPHLDREPALIDEFHRLAAKALPAPAEALVGVGPPAADLTHLHESYRDALLATMVAELVPTFRPVARFDDLGIYGMLAGLPLHHVGRQLLHPGIARLQEIDPDLLGTLESFLDRAGDTRAVADTLGLHRSTVYYRIKRVEEIAGVDLADGEDRLALHLSLKIKNLAGMRTRSTDDGPDRDGLTLT